MKKVYFYAVALLLAAGMTACGGSDSSSAESSSSASVESSESTTTDEGATTDMDLSGNTESTTTASADEWNPEGVYKFSDDGNSDWTVELKAGGKAVLAHVLPEDVDPANYPPMEGGWRKAIDGDYVVLDFFEGPFVKIGDHDYFMDALMTKTHIFYNEDEMKADGPKVAIEKIK